MGKPLLVEIREKPLTSVVVALCCAIWLYLQHRGWGYSQVGTSYRKVVQDRQWWRLMTSQLSHVQLLHLVMNMSSLWSLGFVERAPKMGPAYYAKVTALLMIGSKLILLGFYFFMVKVAKREYYRNVVSVGYSSVIFGWMANLSVGKHKRAKFKFMGFRSVPMPLAPFASLITTSILIPKASFFGHLSGILMGYVIGLGWLEWVDVNWMVTLGVWPVLAWAIYLGLNDRLELPFLRYERIEPDFVVH